MNATETLTILTPFLADICRCVRDAFDTFQSRRLEDPHFDKAVSPRTAASEINDFMCHNAKELFGDVPGVSYPERANSLLLRFGQGIALHFKKLNESDLPCYNRTSRASKLANVDALLPFAELELEKEFSGVVCLVAGYRIDNTNGELQDVIIAQPGGQNRNVWSESIYDYYNPEQSGASLPAPIDPRIPNAVIRPKFRIKEAN